MPGYLQHVSPGQTIEPDTVLPPCFSMKKLLMRVSLSGLQNKCDTLRYGYKTVPVHCKRRHRHNHSTEPSLTSFHGRFCLHRVAIATKSACTNTGHLRGLTFFRDGVAHSYNPCDWLRCTSPCSRRHEPPLRKEQLRISGQLRFTATFRKPSTWVTKTL